MPVSSSLARALGWVVFGAAALGVAPSCGLAGSSSSAGFGGHPSSTTSSSTGGDGGILGLGGATTSVTSSTSSGSGGSAGGASGGGGGGGAGGSSCSPSDGVACCEGSTRCVESEVCCLDTKGSGLGCADACKGQLHAVACETSADCGGSMACCGHWQHGPPPVFDGIACKNACVPPGDPDLQDGEYELCDVGADGCIPPLVCTSDDRLGGGAHGYCKPP